MQERVDAARGRRAVGIVAILCCHAGGWEQKLYSVVGAPGQACFQPFSFLTSSIENGANTARKRTAAGSRRGLGGSRLSRFFLSPLPAQGAKPRRGSPRRPGLGQPRSTACGGITVAACPLFGHGCQLVSGTGKATRPSEPDGFCRDSGATMGREDATGSEASCSSPGTRKNVGTEPARPRRGFRQTVLLAA